MPETREDVEDIIINANRGHEDEPWRLERLDLLRRILQYHKETFLEQEVLIAIGSKTSFRRQACVTHLYDHKGNLAVNWTDTPTKEQQDALASFWETIFCEAEVDHFVQGRPIIDSSGFWNSIAPF